MVSQFFYTFCLIKIQSEDARSKTISPATGDLPLIAGLQSPAHKQDKDQVVSGDDYAIKVCTSSTGSLLSLPLFGKKCLLIAVLLSVL